MHKVGVSHGSGLEGCKSVSSCVVSDVSTNAVTQSSTTTLLLGVLAGLLGL